MRLDGAARQYAEKMDEMHEYLRSFKVPFELRQRVRCYMEYRYPKRKFFRDEDILDLLSPTLATEIKSCLCKGMLEKLALFEDIQPAAMESLRAHMIPRVALEDDLLVRRGEMVDSLFILEFGSVELLHPKGGAAITMRDSSYFGDVSLLKETPALLTVRAKTACRMYVLPRRALHSVLREFPGAATSLRARADERLSEVRELIAADESRTTTSALASKSVA